MKQISRIFGSKTAFPKSADQKALEAQKSAMDTFMLSFSTHEVIMETVRKTLFEIYKARNMSGILLRGLRVDDFGTLKDGWAGTFEERISLLEDDMEEIIDGASRDRLCDRVVELLTIAYAAAGQGGSTDREIYGDWKADLMTLDTRRGSEISILTTPSRILAQAELEDDSATIRTTRITAKGKETE